jgi:hypothetical protein
MNYKPYPKIHALHKEEVENILDYEAVVQVKVDGANSVVYLKDGVVRCGTRTRELPLDEDFRGLQTYIAGKPKIKEFLESHPEAILYGEWLVKHSVNYTQDHYNKWYLFDVYENGEYWPQGADEGVYSVEKLAVGLEVEYPIVYGTGKFTLEQIDAFVEHEWLGHKNEGVVIKPLNYVNKFGDRPYAKRVSQAFKEQNAIVFGGNDKHSDAYWEQYVTNKYCTIATLEKNLNKLAPGLGERLDKKHTPLVAGTCVHDTWTENAWEIFKKVPALDFKKLNNLMMRKYIQLFHDKLDESFSVADMK